GERVPPSRRSHDRMQARAERRQKTNRRLLTVAFGAVPLLVALVAAMVFWPEDEQKPPGLAPVAPVADVKTGEPLEATSTDGFTFRFAGVRTGVDGRVVW